ncbi:hypothetical protein [[Actinomadura] parvosata]|uniref:hypothetical protein n=1 Tax=[Actinomadura] parvosata TaxID=1955412 RepID=UPI0012BBA560|nr:hypothetical protein [Nonomuraea sp. ATCC 55076]
MISNDAFSAYNSYNDELHAILSNSSSLSGFARESIAAHLDGAAYQRLRKTVDVRIRRSHSTFFTGSQLRARLVAPYRHLIRRGVPIMDPACGAGDLLIEALQHLPKAWTLRERCDYAARSLHGWDQIGVLAEVARKRLALALLTSEAAPSERRVAPEFPNIRQGDGIAEDCNYSNVRLILLNPPFARTLLPVPQSWGEGVTSQAAPFTLEVLKKADDGTRMAAILPDVLRSGSRYNRWRDEIEKLADIKKIEPIGLFDIWTDVDVFIAHMVVRSRKRRKANPREAWQDQSLTPGGTVRLGDVATISIGDVVPHRHADEGPTVPYLTVHDVPVGATVTHAPTRRFAGRLHQAPFVVLRRTSAPTRAGGERLSVSIIDGSLGEVAVENHLVVVRPLDGSGLTCDSLKSLLEHPSVTKWLDARIRTRHLTKTSLLDLPLQGMQLSVDD